MNDESSGALIVGGYVQGDGSGGAVVQFGGIEANATNGVALYVGKTSLGNNISVEGSINIDGNIISQSTT